MAAGSADTAHALVVEVTDRSPAATWAWRRRGLGDLRRGAAAEAATALQTVLRDRPADAAAWEGLGAAYEATGRLTAALKVRLQTSIDSQTMQCCCVPAERMEGQDEYHQSAEPHFVWAR